MSKTETLGKSKLRRALEERHRIAMQEWRSASEKTTDPRVAAAHARYVICTDALSDLARAEAASEDDT